MSAYSPRSSVARKARAASLESLAGSKRRSGVSMLSVGVSCMAFHSPDGFSASGRLNALPFGHLDSRAVIQCRCLEPREDYARAADVQRISATSSEVET
jgi:hypothetical protein